MGISGTVAALATIGADSAALMKCFPAESSEIVV